MSKYNIKDMDLFAAHQNENIKFLKEALEAMKRGESVSHLHNADGSHVNPSNYQDGYYQTHQQHLVGEDNQDQGCCCIIS